MITYNNDAPEYAARSLVESPIATYIKEVRQVLPELPGDLTIWLDNTNLIEHEGTGGAAYDPETITIAFDTGFADKALQLRNLRATIFHEAYHIVQGFTFEDRSCVLTTLLDDAIYEGAATVFEREYAGSSPAWGEYGVYDEQLLARWRDELRALLLTPGAWGERHDAWKFYDPQDGERWKLYRAGTWCVDRALSRSGKDILELRTLSAHEILQLSGD